MKEIQNTNESADLSKRPRKDSGFSLAAIMVLGLVIMGFVSGLMQIMMPVYRSVGGLNWDTQLRGLSEMGVDYAIAQMNTGAQGWDLSQIPGANAAPGTSITQQVPQSIVNNNNASVSIKISSPGNPGSTSMLYDPLLNTNYPNSFRMLTVSATYGPTTKQTRVLLQPIINSKAGNTQYPYALFGIASVIFAGQSALNTYNAPASKPYLVQNGADGGSLGKISQIYGGGGLTRSIAEGGSHYEFPNPLSTYNQQFNIAGQTYNARPASSAPWMNLYGNVYSNGANTAYFSLNGPGDQNNASSAHNVFGISNGIDPAIYNPLANSANASNALMPVGSPPSWSGGSVGFNQVGANGGYTYNQPAIPSPQSAPPGAIDLGPVTITNGSQLVIDSTAPAPTGPLGTIGSKGAQIVKIPPGNYIMSSLTVSKGTGGGSGSSISIAPQTQTAIASGTAPNTQIYLQGTTTPSTAMSVDNYSSINMTGVAGSGVNTSGRTNLNNSNATASNQIALNHPSDAAVSSTNISESAGSANQLQIFSNYGSGTNFYLQGNERMIFNAPYGNVTIGSILSNGAPTTINKNANFYGSIFATNIVVQSDYNSGGGAFVHYDYKLHPNGNNNPWAAWSPVLTPQAVIGYRAVSWQEQVQGAGASQSWAYSYQ